MGFRGTCFAYLVQLAAGNDVEVFIPSMFSSVRPGIRIFVEVGILSATYSSAEIMADNLVTSTREAYAGMRTEKEA